MTGPSEPLLPFLSGLTTSPDFEDFLATIGDAGGFFVAAKEGTESFLERSGSEFFRVVVAGTDDFLCSVGVDVLRCGVGVDVLR